MQNNIKVWIESSTLSFDLNSHDEGVYLISDLDGLTSLPSIRTSAGVNAGTDGGWTSAQAFDARLISLSVVIANEDVSIVESKRRLLNSLLAQSRKETLKLHFTTEAGMEFIINVRITAVTGALTNILKKQELLIQMRADDPIIYGAQGGEGADATLLVQQTQSGFEIPFEIPLLIGGGSDKVDVEDLGTEEVYPIIKMTGPLHNPTVVNETQNAEIGINADLGDMEWRGYQSAELLGNTTQTTLSGKNLSNIYAIPNQTGASLKITIADETITIKDNANIVGYTNTQKKLSEVCPTLQVGDTVYLFFNTTSSSAQKDNIYIQGTGANIYWERGTSKTITQAMLDSIVVLYGGHDETAVISNFMITATNDSTYEKYVGGIPAPNPDFPQVVNTVSGAQTVKITGKNLIDPTLLNPNVYHMDSPSSRYYYDANLQFHVKADTTYTLSLKMDELSSQDSFMFSVGIGDSLYRRDINTVSNITDISQRIANTFTVSQADIDKYGDVLFMRCPRYGSSRVFSHTLSDIQLELGNQATTYEAYQGQSYDINLGGTNLLDISGSAEQSGTTLKFENDEVKASGTASASMTFTLINGIKYAQTYWQTLKPNDTNSILLPKGTYYFSGTYSIATTSVQYRLVDDGDTMENGTSVSLNSSFTISSPKRFCIAVYVNNGNTPSGSFKLPQLNKGSTALPYAPYTTYAYELAKIGTYQDYIWNDNGTWKIHKEVGKVVFNGTESWGTSAYGTNSWGLSSVINCPYDTSKMQIISNIFRGCSNDDRSTAGDNVIYTTLANAFVIRNTTLTTLASVQSATSGNYIYYALATPTDTEITDAELVGQLDALLNYAPWYGDDQNVFLIPSAGAQGELILGAHNEPKPADEVLIDTHLKTVTLNGQNAYPLLKDGSSFFSLAPGDNIMYLTSDVSSDTGKAEIKFKQGFISI